MTSSQRYGGIPFLSNCSSFQYYSMMSQITFVIRVASVILHQKTGKNCDFMKIDLNFDSKISPKIAFILGVFINLILLEMQAMSHENYSLKLSLANHSNSKLTREQSQSLAFLHQDKSPTMQKSLYYQNIPMNKDVPNWNQSSATLRHSSTAFRFAKSSRFPQQKCNYQDSQQLQYPSTFNRRSTSQGIGKRADIPEVFVSGKFKVTENCPFYEVDKDQFERSNSAVILGRAKTFGLGWGHYEASRTPHRSTVHSSHQQKCNPAPNRYVLNPEEKNQSPKLHMHKRLQMFTTKNGSYRRNHPDPQSYEIKEKLVVRSRSGNGFGYGNKTDFTKLKEQTPGPIYRETSLADKFIHLKLKLKQI